MAGYFAQIYIHLVFVVKYRRPLIDASWEDELYKYITGIIQGKNQWLIAINGMPDHVHILIGIRPSCCLSDLIREIKKASNAFIQEKGFCRTKFQWQAGYGAFSCRYSDIDDLVSYIKNQKERHRRKSFRSEFKEMLEVGKVEFEERYLEDWLGPKNTPHL